MMFSIGKWYNMRSRNNTFKMNPLLPKVDLTKPVLTKGDNSANSDWYRTGTWPYFIFVTFFTQPQFEAGKFYT